MIFRFKAKHLLVLVSLFFLSVGPGCSQQRYKPAKWRAAQRDADAKDQGSSAGTKSGAGTSAWASGREMGTMPVRVPVRGGGTLPRRGWDTGTLPNRGAGSTMPARQFERGSTLPQRGWQAPDRGNSTLPQRSWQPKPRQGTMPSRRYEEIKYRVPAEVAEVEQPELVQQELNQPELVPPKLNQTELNQTELNQPKLIQPELPELVQPELSQSTKRKWKVLAPIRSSTGVSHGPTNDVPRNPLR